MRSIASYGLAFILIGGAACANPASAQNAPSPPSTPPDRKEGLSKDSTPAPPFAERLSTTSGKLSLRGETVRYKSYAGTLPLVGKDGKADAEVFYVAYHREGVKKPSERPVTFVFNGGPGSASLWLHLGTFGPRRVSFDDAVHPSPPPYNIVDNKFSILDETDLVFIDPVGTGYSRTVDDGTSDKFLGVKEDIDAVAEFIRLYVTRTGRWNSPKFLAGESYGTTRAAGVVGKLQRDGMFFNGLILISAILDFQTTATRHNNDLAYALFFPTLAATAAYHAAAPKIPDSREVRARVQQAKEFVTNEYVGALMAGYRLSPAKREEVAQRYAQLTGLSPEYVKQNNLRISAHRFRKELMRKYGQAVGRLDSRYLGLEPSAGSPAPDHDPSFTAIFGPYTAAMNHYLKNELKATVDHPYEVLNWKVNRDWNWGLSRGGYVDVASDLAKAMRTNPYLQVYVANGYYDLATPFFATEYTVDHLQIPASVRVNLKMSYFDAGHMMYLHDASLRKLKEDLSSLFARARRAASQSFRARPAKAP